MRLLWTQFFELGHAGMPGFAKKQADLFFPPDFADDFPVAMQVDPFSNVFKTIPSIGTIHTLQSTESTNRFQH